MDPLTRLTTLLAKLPGVGDKSALRIGLAILDRDQEYVDALAGAITAAKSTLRYCSICCDLCAAEVCSICSDAKRDPKVICVVATPQDRMAFERAAVFRGRYHVLHGVIDPLSGVTPAELRIAELLRRLHDVTEVILATGATVEGEITALWLARILAPLEVVVTRIAVGVAVGGQVEFADMATLGRALEDRRPIT